ncbi:hypothetical protein ODU75_05250 [Lactobacillus amylovorus]|uniref:hypothetical protein n=1 Tax=Lactobacillus amylovorus TaxID=1604 RepID=UPI00232B9C84|nr:hypothetical protein [Lactobacillus amylovorus]MDB6266086.1 hypothetical protein [Lactobacillus amylovorus]
MREYNKRQAPSPNGWNNRILLPILGIFFVFAGFILKILSFNIPWFALVIDLIAKWIIVVGIVCMIPSTWRWLIRAQNDLKQSNTKYDLSALRSYKFEQKLYSMRIFEKDSYDCNKIRLPQVVITDYGFKLTAIGNLRKQMLDDDTIGDFNSFLSLNNAKCAIQSAYYRDGYVHYIVRHAIEKDRLHF